MRNMRIQHNIEFDMILRGIVAARGNEGATIAEMRADYYDIVCDHWPLQSIHTNKIVGYLLEIEGLIMVREEDGPCIWYIDDLGNVSHQIGQDSNNNEVIVIDDVSTIDSVTEASTNNSYALSAPPRVQPNVLASSSLNISQPSVIALTSSSDSCLFTGSLESQQNENRKRDYSKGSSEDMFAEHPKRPRAESPSRLPLIHKNLQIHNQQNGTVAKPKKSTSTEVEHSSSAQNGFSGNEKHLNG